MRIFWINSLYKPHIFIAYFDAPPRSINPLRSGGAYGLIANTMLQPSDIGLILSYQCQSACAHCLYNCGPGWSEWMSPEVVREALDRTKKWGVPFHLHITGGEPFLNFPLLLYAVEEAVRSDIFCYTETNAGWCIDEKQVRKRFLALRQAGLGLILISCSPFHAEAIPPRRTLLAVALALEIFGPRRVIVYTGDWLDLIQRFSLDTAIPLERYVESFGLEPASLMFWEGYGLISGGRSGYRLSRFTARKTASAFRHENCCADILAAGQSHLDPYGNLIPGFCTGLSIGDWRSLPDLLAKIRRRCFSPLISLLIESGPYGLAEMASKEHHYRPLRGGYAGKCHLCVDVRRHLHAIGGFEELRPDGFYEEFV